MSGGKKPAHIFEITEEEEIKRLDEAVKLVSASSFSMKRCLDSGRRGGRIDKRSASVSWSQASAVPEENGRHYLAPDS